MKRQEAARLKDGAEAVPKFLSLGRVRLDFSAEQCNQELELLRGIG